MISIDSNDGRLLFYKFPEFLPRWFTFLPDASVANCNDMDLLINCLLDLGPDLS